MVCLDFRDQLLDYDPNMAKRTHVIDDQADYFNTDSNKSVWPLVAASKLAHTLTCLLRCRWQSRQERDAARHREQELREQQKEGRRTTKMTIDFAGRRLVEEEPDVVDIYEEERLKQDVERTQARLATARGPVVERQRPTKDELMTQSRDLVAVLLCARLS